MMKTTINVLTVCLLLAGAHIAARQSKAAHVTSADTVKFMPLDPSNPGGIQVAPVSGEMMGKGPAVFFMKLPKGPAPVHSHSAGYHATVIRGEAKHWPAGGEKSAQVLGPGSHWYQPGKQDHGDECLSAECLLLLQMEGGFDFIPAQK
jgi:hypothetical protein